MNDLIPFQEMQSMATAVCNGGLFPALKNKDQILSLLLLAQAENIHPINALRRFHIIDDKPSMRADAMLAGFRAKGGKVKWLNKADDKEAQVGLWTFEGVEQEIGFTMAEAKAAGYYNPKPGSGWQRDPAAMLRARSISRATRMLCPEVVVGLYTPEEVSDFDDAPLPPSRRGRSAPAEAVPEQTEVAVVGSAPLAKSTEPAATTAAPTAAAPASLPLKDAAPADEAKRLIFIRGQFNQALLAAKMPKEFQKVRGDFERTHGKEMLDVATGHKPGETFRTLMTDHWNRIARDSAQIMWAGTIKVVKTEADFRPLEDQFLNAAVDQSKENELLLNEAGSRLGIAGYGAPVDNEDPNASMEG